MGYPDGYYYGQGRIICDTSTFSVGDTIRVRSVYNALQTEDKQVVTVGTPLIFTVPPYDYYKICKVVDIGGVDTEIGGVFTSIDYGQTYHTKVIDDTTLQGMQQLLNAHQENNIEIGHEITITVDNAPYPVILLDKNRYNNHEMIFGSKYIWKSYQWDSSTDGKGTYANSPLRTQCNDFYTRIDIADRTLIKDKQVVASAYQSHSSTNDKIWLPTPTELLGANAQQNQLSAEEKNNNVQFAYFVTQANRVKTLNGVANSYYTASGAYLSDYYRYWWCVKADGQSEITAYDSMPGAYTDRLIRGLLPCFHLTEDS